MVSKKKESSKQLTVFNPKVVKESSALIGDVSCTKENIVGCRINEENKLQISLMLHKRPHISTREIAAETNISKSNVNRIVLKHKFHPYLNLHQKLYDKHFANKVTFCIPMNGIIDKDNNSLNKIQFSDEVKFKNNKSVNKYSMRCYAIESPHWLKTIDHQRR